MNITKICSHCLNEKEITNFQRRSDSTDGYRGVCKKCINEKDKIYRDSNKEKFREKGKRKYIKHKERMRKYAKEYRSKNKDNIREKNRKYEKENKIKIRERKRNYSVANKIKINERKRKYRKTRYHKDPKYRLRCNIRNRLSCAFSLFSKHGKTKSCKEYGIDFDEIYNKIGPRPQEGYEIDHIIPLSKFNLDDTEHVRLAHLPCNLQWLSKIENCIKHDTIPEIAYENLELRGILKYIGVIND